jgi:hypothetical protein
LSNFDHGHHLVVQIKNMDSIELFPSLSHCIETTAKEEFWNSVNQYAESGQEDKIIEEKIELLKAFLESMDFKKLRSQSERYLIESKRVKFVISWKEGKPSYEMVVIKATD